ncbi:ATP-binding response regulator [Virgisporangium aurantiacum]|nr:response regulator [Virgisporangium aurantiacum]
MIATAVMFALIFARAIFAFLWTRDRLQGAVALVLVSVAALYVLQVSRVLAGAVPGSVRLPALIALYGQPLLTLALVAMIRSVAWAWPGLAFGYWLGASAAVITLPSPLPNPATMSLVGGFVLLQSVAAGYLVAEARKRKGAARARIGFAATGTFLFGLVLLIAASNRVFPSLHLSEISRIVALGPTLAYVVAFMPPGWLRRQWSARTAYTLMGRLLAAPASATQPRDIWQHFVDTVRDAMSAEGTVVVIESGPLVVAGSAPSCEVPSGGRPERGSAKWTKIDGRRYLLIAIPLTMEDGTTGTLLVFGLHRSLFSEDDIAVLADLGRQATVLADRAVLTSQLTDTVAQLRAANEAKSDFLAAMSHELRTPLNAIIGFSELMGYEELVGDRRHVPDEWIGNVHSSGRHLLGLINDVLDLAKVEAGRIELRLEPIDVGAAVAEAVAPLTSLIDAKKLRLTLAAPPEVVTADRLRLRQMLNNLLSNAIKFTPDEGAIYVSAHRDGAFTHLSVADTGPGIEPAEQARVFEEFHQAGDAASRAAGTGLGLALTRRLAEAQQGRVELWSEVGQGSRFTLVLPAATAPAPHAPSAEAPATDHGGVLVIEDDPAAVSLLRTYLTGAGYPIHVAATGEAGIALAGTAHPDLILLDVQLPGIDGWSVLRKLKKDERLWHIPVVVVTVIDEREVALALGAVDYFVKPVERRALLDSMARNTAAAAAADPTGPGGPAGPRRPDVLVLDPSEAARERTGQWLRDCGVAAALAGSVADATGLAESTPFDLILCDAAVTGPDGTPVLDALRASPATRPVPVVMLTDGTMTPADVLLAGLMGGPPTDDDAPHSAPLLGVVSRADLSAQHLQRWLGDRVHPLVVDDGPALERVST